MRQTILVVDDDEGIIEVVQLVLESEGFNVQTSLTGDCLHHLNDIHPDLILLDVLLLGEDGRDICLALKSNPETAHIPVIILSAHSDAGEAADMSGADDFIEKPFDLDTLIGIVKKHLSSTNAQPQLMSEEALG